MNSLSFGSENTVLLGGQDGILVSKQTVSFEVNCKNFTELQVLVCCCCFVTRGAQQPDFGTILVDGAVVPFVSRLEEFYTFYQALPSK